MRAISMRTVLRVGLGHVIQDVLDHGDLSAGRMGYVRQRKQEGSSSSSSVPERERIVIAKRSTCSCHASGTLKLCSFSNAIRASCRDEIQRAVGLVGARSARGSRDTRRLAPYLPLMLSTASRGRISSML